MHHRPRSSRLALAVATAAVVTLAACGSDSDGAASTTGATTAATEPAATEPAATESAATEPAATEPAATEPAATEPAATEPADTEAPDTTPTTAAPAGNLIEVATAAGTFTTLLAALDAAGLTDTIASGKFTILAPTDEAFAALGQPAIDALLADPAQLTAVLQNHVLPVPQDLRSITIFNSIVTLGGGSLPVTSEGDVVTIGGATVVQADVPATNGYIDVIDTVLLPA